MRSRHNPKPVIRESFTLYTPESVERGDAAEHGWIDEDGVEMTPDEYDAEEGLTAVDKAVKHLRSEGATEASASHFHPGVWYLSMHDPDFRTGDQEERSFHLDGFTLEQERAIFEQMTKRHNPEWAKKLGRAIAAPRRAKQRVVAAAAVQREKAAQRAAASKAAWESKKAKAREYVSEVKRDFGEGFRANPKLSRCAQQYLETALWSSTDEDGEPLDRHYSVSDFSSEAIAAAERECAEFMEHNDTSGLSDSDVGHNFWLTRNRHGAGFWDLGIGKQGETLTKAAHAYGACDLYLGDDEKLHLT